MHSIETAIRTGIIGDEKEVRKTIKEIIDEHRETNGAIIRILQSAQHVYGYLPLQVMRIISEEMKIPPSEVSGIVSFYSFFSTVPKGRHVIQVCKGTSCYVKGAEKIFKKLKQDWNLIPDGITEDGRFSLEPVYCLGACGLSPVIAIDGEVHGKVKPGQIADILNLYE